jgi:hypothetical protein
MPISVVTANRDILGVSNQQRKYWPVRGFKEEVVMDSYRTVCSFSSGTIEKVIVDERAYLYESQPILLIKTESG